MNQWNDKRYHNLNFELRERFGKKMVKLSLDGGFTCPNRDGTLSEKGCVFCSERGSGDFAGSRWAPLQEQIDQQIILLTEKWPKAGYLAYLQNFTNTYGETESLGKLYREIVADPRIEGLAIATRADCLNDDVIALLEGLSHKTFLWVEIGIQSIHASTREWMNRHEDLDQAMEMVERLQSCGIRVVVHLILGLPGETENEMIESVKAVGDLAPWGIKLHLLHIMIKTPLAEWYQAHPFDMMERGAYIDLLVKCLVGLSPDITIHRLTGDAPRDRLLAPKWAVRKRLILNGLDQALRQGNLWQGKSWMGSKRIWEFNG
ncbi:TIGR01212 family radical SAM protein [Gottschalkiaceae bacterium SANA]|nr:TIGR01212 family radical SAM protein [Gottschalkiaceae bacterium SANA]